jgi:capsular exopolysaccharide synthesis family protein
MSKFFNQTLRSRDGLVSTSVFSVAGLQDTVVSEAEIRPEVVEPERASPASEEPTRVQIPPSRLLTTQFQGSKSLHSAQDSYRALRTRLLRLSSQNGLKSIVITSSIPGEGKTMTSLNLALCCSQLHETRVLLIDGDIRTGELSRNLGVPSGAGLAEVLEGKCSGGAAVLETDHPNLHFCSCGSTSLPPAELYAGRSWQEFMAWCKQSFSLVIVDSPPIMTMADVELMTVACDGVLLVVRARHTRREELKKSASQIDAKKLLGVVYNATDEVRHNYYYAGPREK